jgi:hypothetical protein
MAVVSLSSVGVGVAQDATERAGELKTWRDQCSDPDTDLRTAYLEAAIATSDVAVIRICVRQSLESDDADIRNLGLRAALASIDQLMFEVTMPPELQAALKKAGDDQKQLAEINDWYVMRDWRLLQTGFAVEIDGAEVEAGKSTWYPLANRESRSNNYTGTASVIGDKISWVGGANLSRSTCRMNLTVVPGAQLEGTLQCADLWPFAVRASLL